MKEILIPFAYDSGESRVLAVEELPEDTKATIYYPFPNYEGDVSSQGGALSGTANTGFSTGTHLHQTVLFSYKGTERIPDPLTVSHN